MYRMLVFCVLCCLVVAPAIAQPGGGPGTGGLPVCQVAVLQDCQVISGLGGRCIDTGTHSCVYDIAAGTWRCNPGNGIDMVDNVGYLNSVPASTGQSGWLHWVNHTADACGFMETCKCHQSLAFCFDDVRNPWGPGDDIPDPGVYSIPPTSDCVGQ